MSYAFELRWYQGSNEYGDR